MERFWSKVDMEGECWEWLASFGTTGYGQFSFEGRPRKAHRVAWILTYGDIPADKFVLHTCDNSACVRPTHLYLGTQSNNVQDAYDRGRKVSYFGLRTHCLQGHLYDEQNTYWWGTERKCRTCTNARAREYTRRKNA